MALVTLDAIRNCPRVQIFMKKADDYIGMLGYTEHGYRHSDLVAKRAQNILQILNYSLREAELAAISGFLHDIGNIAGRKGHDRLGAMIAMRILEDLGMPDEEIADVIAAIGSHDETSGSVVNCISAALILADKSDVHRLRVRKRDFSTFDIHDRVNYAVADSSLLVNGSTKIITLKLKIDTSISHVMEYFEIFLTRMIMCRRSASFLDTRFSLIINEVELL